MDINEAVAYAEKYNYHNDIIEKLKDYRALLMFLANAKSNEREERK